MKSNTTELFLFAVTVILAILFALNDQMIQCAGSIIVGAVCITLVRR